MDYVDPEGRLRNEKGFIICTSAQDAEQNTLENPSPDPIIIDDNCELLGVYDDDPIMKQLIRYRTNSPTFKGVFSPDPDKLEEAKAKMRVAQREQLRQNETRRMEILKTCKPRSEVPNWKPREYPIDWINLFKGIR